MLGERWTLLVIRELLLGQKRFSDLLDGLPGIGDNILAQRLKSLQEAGLIRRTVLPPPAASTVYELTPLGQELKPAVLELARWGLHFLGEPRQDDYFRVGWLLGGIQAAFNADAAAGVDETYEFRVDHQVFHVHVCDRQIEVAQGTAHRPDVVITSDADTFCEIGCGRLDAAQALSEGRFQVEGDPAAAARCAEIFGAAMRAQTPA